MLTFEERTEGWRVLRANGIMIASVKTRYGVPVNAMNDTEFKAVIDELGLDEAVKARAVGLVVYKPLPVAECTIHSASGPLSVADLKEMIAEIEG